MESEYKVESRDWVVLFLLALVWGASFMFIKKAIAIYSPTQVAFWRVSLSVLFNIPVFFVYRSQIPWAKWRSLAIIALAGSAVPSILFAYAQKSIESSLAGILNALTPFFALLLSVWLYRVTIRKHQLLGVILGLCGAFILIVLDPDRASLGGGSHIWAAILCILATICYAVSAITITQTLKGAHPAAIGAGSFLLLSPVFFTGLYFSGGIHQLAAHPDGLKGLIYIVFLSGIGTVGASFLYFGLLQRTGALFGTGVTYLLPIVSMLFGAFDGEAIHLTDILGSGIILMSLYLAKKVT
jgi:drug/metabolite transporter (DMT)-like permease